MYGSNLLKKYISGFYDIDVDILSVVTQQLMTLKETKLTRKKKILFEGREIKFNISCGIFTTMTQTEALERDIRTFWFLL